MFSGQMRPEALHTFVDTFVEGKKAQVKQRLRQAMETVLDDLFGEMLVQLKEMLLPAKADPPTETAWSLSNEKTAEAASHSTPKQAGPKSPKSRGPVFAVKSKPSTLNRPAGGEKRPREPNFASPAATSSDRVSVNINYCSDKEPMVYCTPENTFTATKKARIESEDQPNNANDDDSVQISPPPIADDDALAKFACLSPGCGKRFKKLCNLKDHERVHSGVTPFSCKYPGCSYVSKKRTHVMHHIRSVHMKHLEPGAENNPKLYLEVNEELLK